MCLKYQLDMKRAFEINTPSLQLNEIYINENKMKLILDKVIYCNVRLSVFRLTGAFF